MKRGRKLRNKDPNRKPIGTLIDVRLWREFKSLAVKKGIEAGRMLDEAIEFYLSNMN